MSNFTCPTCGLTNIDCGKAGYKTAREIELEKKLEIAVEALEFYALKNIMKMKMFILVAFSSTVMRLMDMSKMVLKHVKLLKR